MQNRRGHGASLLSHAELSWRLVGATSEGLNSGVILCCPIGKQAGELDCEISERRGKECACHRIRFQKYVIKILNYIWTSVEIKWTFPLSQGISGDDNIVWIRQITKNFLELRF